MDAGPSTVNKSRDTFDYVIVGGGAAGCVLANRLSENRTKKVLLLEAGGEADKFTQHVPLGFPYLVGSPIDWAYVTLPEPTLNGRRLYIPRGRVLGGSHAISVMLYHRGAAHDYDANWPAGWSSEDVLPYFLKSEKQSADRFRNSESHSANGNLTVSDLACVNPMSAAFVEAARATGIEQNPDFNDWTRDQAGVGTFQVTQRNGVREAPATAYLSQGRRRSNLTVRSGVFVEKLIFENSDDGAPYATGVSYVDANSERYTVNAQSEVVLAGGVYATPQLLMLSGVGPGEHLREHGIDVISDAPQVGQNLQDHAAVVLSFESKAPLEDKRDHLTYYTEKTGKSPLTLLNYLFRGRGPLTSPMCEAGGFVRTSDELDAPDLQLRFVPFFSEPDPYESLSDFATKGDYLRNRADRPAGFTVQSVLARPRSRGSVELVSADARDRVAITANWMSDESDVETLVRGLKLSRRVAAQAQFEPYRGSEKYPGADVVSEEQLRDYVLGSCHTANAMVGTCRMGDDSESVVDSNLMVRGVRGLRVADSSVMPTLPGGQSGAPTMMIAEKAADLIKQAA